MIVRTLAHDGTRFFRVVPGVLAQFGLHGTPAVSAVWKDATMPSDRPLASSTRGLHRLWQQLEARHYS